MGRGLRLSAAVGLRGAIYLLGLALLLPVTFAQNEFNGLTVDKDMPVAQALETVQSELKRTKRTQEGSDCHCTYLPLDGISVDRQGFQFHVSGEDRGCWIGGEKWSSTVQYQYTRMAYVQPPPSKWAAVHLTGPKVSRCESEWYSHQKAQNDHSHSGGVYLEWNSQEDAIAFAKALNRLIWEYSPEAVQHRDSEWAQFQQQARTWRHAGAKVPDFSDDARREKLLAEDAISEKNFESAVRHYEAGLRVQPLWPEAWFNLGLIYGEMKDYVEAADRMKHYLELMPDATNAQEAKDKVLLWEAKEKEAEQ